jgi:hypothetical protein
MSCRNRPSRPSSNDSYNSGAVCGSRVWRRCQKPGGICHFLCVYLMTMRHAVSLNAHSFSDQGEPLIERTDALGDVSLLARGVPVARALCSLCRTWPRVRPGWLRQDVPRPVELTGEYELDGLTKRDATHHACSGRIRSIEISMSHSLDTSKSLRRAFVALTGSRQLFPRGFASKGGLVERRPMGYRW